MLSSVKFGIAAASLFVAGSASAAIVGTFVAAVDGGNSFQSVDGTSAFSDTTATTGLWHDRPGVFDIIGMASPLSGAYQGQNITGAQQTHNEVITTITGLTAGTSYSIDIVYGINTAGNSGDQDIDAGFASGGLTTFVEGDGAATGEGLMAGGGATWVAVQATIGTAVANGSGEIEVYVGATLDAERSVYNGLTYTEVPEPGSLALLGLGGLALLRRRRA